MDIKPLFKSMIEKGASNLFLTVGMPPCLKINGVMSALEQPPLSSDEMVSLAKTLMSEAQQKEFATNLELNMVVVLDGIGRFRLNAFRQRGDIALVILHIEQVIPSLSALGLPPLLSSLVMELNGLILVVGATGSGKSTTLASMIDYRNSNHTGHILTIEDPIEFIHPHKKSIVAQREVGLDTLSYENALINAMRESPDLILIGEIRAPNTMKQALIYADTGHLCLATLHANNANQTLERIINFFPEDNKPQILSDLSLTLRAIISLRLIPTLDNKRVPAVEVLVNTPYVSELIEQGRVDDIKDAMEKGQDQGMQTFDQALIALYQKGLISKDNAIHYADSKNNIRLALRLSEDALSPPASFSLRQDDEAPS